MRLETVRHFSARQKRPLIKYAALLEQPPASGKTYEEYLAEAMQRPVESGYRATCGLMRDWDLLLSLG